MSSEQELNLNTENVEPPEEKLTAPCLSDNQFGWIVVAKNKRTNRAWEELIARYPENAKRCYEYLHTKPTTKVPGRIFPLKGQIYQGAWEYEIAKGDRVFYTPHEEIMKVVVYYAGKHPKGNVPPP
jgi:hypothetical protein